MTSVLLRRLFLVTMLLTFAVVLWFHPPGGENVYEGVRGDVDAWLFVHTACFAAAAVPIERTRAREARALGPTTTAAAPAGTDA